MESRETFMKYLREEMESAGERYQRALAVILDAPDLRASPAASEEFIEATRIYIGAIRRIAHFASNGEPNRTKSLTQHA